MHQTDSRIDSGLGARAILLAIVSWALLLPTPAPTASGAKQSESAHYDVKARFEPASGYLRASVVITLPASQVRADPVFLLNERLSVDPGAFGKNVRISAAPTDRPVAGLQAITLHTASAPNAPQRLHFRYEGLVRYFDNDAALSPDRVELRLERFWLPLRSDLHLTFTVDADIRGLPKGVAVTTQGRYQQRGSRLTIQRTFADLDLPIAGTPGMQKFTGPDVEFHTNDADDPFVSVLREHSLGAAAFFRKLYGPPDGGPLRVVVVPRAEGGAYARRNFLVLPTYRKPGEPAPKFEASTAARTVAHETEHAWMPSPAVGGENYYVSESIAEYMAMRYIGASFGAREQAAVYERKRQAAVDAGSLLTERRPTNAALYQKGPLLLGLLADEIGESTLDRILSRRDRPRTHREFLAALTAEAGEDVAKQFEAQLGQTGLPSAIAASNVVASGANDAAETKASADETSTATYSIVMSGTVKGELTVRRESAGVRRTSLRFDDRGRGPDLTTVSRHDPRGVLESLSVDGVDYAKRAVGERFSSQGGHVTWKSSADSGSEPAGAYYLVNDSNAEDLAALARALLKAPAGELPLLPAGRARIEKNDTRDVRSNGRSASPALYSISGLGLQPAHIWLDPEQELFAAGGSWLATVRRGFESALPELLAEQDRVSAAAAAERNRGLRRVPGHPVLFRNANVFDAESRTMRAGLSVLVRGERIAAVGTDSSIEAPADAEVIDAAGRALIPGLWDMHVHVLDTTEGVMDLLAGVTSVRDLGNDPDALELRLAKYRDGTAPGPTVYRAGLIEGPGPLAAPFGKFVETPQQVRDAVNFFADRGYEQIKLYSSLSPKLVSEARAAAHTRGLRVAGHVPAGMTLREAVLAGFDEIQHANFWFLNFMPPDVIARTNSPIRFSAVYEHARELDLSTPEVRELIELLRSKGTVVDPTLVVFENMFTGTKGELAPWVRPWAARLPASTQRGGRSGGRATTAEQRAAYTESFVRMKQMLKALHAAGVPIVAGTDGSPLQLSRELELYVEAGIPAADVLYLATLGSARVMRQDAQTGSIAPGKRADLVLLDGDPLHDIGAVRDTRLVMKGGDIYEAAALARAAGLTPAAPPKGASAP